MTHEEHRAVRELLGAYTLGQLDTPTRAAVDAHLADCPLCRVELAEIATTATSLRHVDPDLLAEPVPTAPPHLREAVFARIRAERAQLGRRARWAGIAVAAAIAAVVGLGVGWWAHPDAAQPAVALEEVAISPADPRIDASAQLVPHTWGTEIKLTATGFETGQPYRVTVTESGGRRVPAGEFLGTGPDQMRCNLNSSVLRASATGFDVTDPTGTVVLAASF